MPSLEEKSTSPPDGFRQACPGPKVSILTEMRISGLRDAIRGNKATFPSQVPTFPKHDRPDLQRRMVQLYFLCGWSGSRIGVRCGVSRLRVQQILSAWKRRAVETGYIQSIPPAEVFAAAAEQLPVRVILSPVFNTTPVPVHPITASAHGSLPPPIAASPLGSYRRKDRRPREEFEISHIVSVLEQLKAGRTLAEVASEMEAMPETIRLWSAQCEVRLLKHENAVLKAQLAKLNAVETSLLDLVLTGDGSANRRVEQKAVS